MSYTEQMQQLSPEVEEKFTLFRQHLENLSEPKRLPYAPPSQGADVDTQEA